MAVNRMDQKKRPDQRSPEDPSASIQLHARKLVCENTVFSVFFDHVSGAGGHDVPNYLSIVPKNATLDDVTGVGILPVQVNKIGLIRVFRHPLARWAWEAPKGFVDAGETPRQAALRELAEETGFSVPISSLRLLGTVTPESGVIKGRTQLFSVSLEGGNTFKPVSNSELGHGKMRFFERREINCMVAAGQIEDACALSLFYLHFMQPECGQA